MSDISYHPIKITCEEREALIDSVGRSYNGPAEPWVVISGLTDLDGKFGEPSIYTKWGHRVTEQPLLSDERWPGSDRPCEHYRYEEIPASRAALSAFGK